MKDQAKTKQTLIGELASLRKRIAQLEQSESEHRQVEEALRASENRYYKLFKHMSSGVAIYEAVEMMNYEAAGLIALSFIPISYAFLLLINRLNARAGA